MSAGSHRAKWIASLEAIVTLYSTIMPSPVGDLTLIASRAGLAAVLWGGDRPGRVVLERAQPTRDHPVLRDATRQLAAYFDGTLTRFSLPLDPRGSVFQRNVWDALLTIPYGETRSYAAVALQIGCPAPRAVGAANGRNPLSIVIPCHRVVGTGGALTGFAGGLAAKQWLLDHEAEPRTSDPIGRNRAARRPDPVR